jgi:hypothetical protein
MTLKTHAKAGWLAIALAVGSCKTGEEQTVPLPPASETGPAAWNPSADYEPGVTASELAAQLNNPLFPGAVGTRWMYEGKTDEGTERIEVEVLAETHRVWGTTATVIRDTVYLDGELIEDTWDWYAEDRDGRRTRPVSEVG